MNTNLTKIKNVQIFFILTTKIAMSLNENKTKSHHKLITR